MTETIERDATRIQPPHEVCDEEKLASLVGSMRTHGWQGAPLVVIPGIDYGWGPGDPRAICGSHRIVAAEMTDVEVPTIDLPDLLAEHGADWDALVTEMEQAGFSREAAEYEVVVRLEEHLPAAVIEYYGLDAH
jgi:hypothetical protein